PRGEVHGQSVLPWHAPGEDVERMVRLEQRVAPGSELLDREPARLQDADGERVAAALLAVRATDRERLQRDLVREQPWDWDITFDARDHDGPTRTNDVDRVGEGVRGVRHDVDHAVGPTSPGDLINAGPQILALHVDRHVDAEVTRDLQLVRVRGQAGDH